MSEIAIDRRGGPGRPGAARAARWLALLVPTGLLAGALGSQYVGGLNPCEMCHWQRWAHGAAIPLALLAFTAPAPGGRSLALTLAAAAMIALSGLIGSYHWGVELGLVEGVTSCSSAIRATDADAILKEIMAVPLVRCDQVQWSLLGISMAGWNAILSLGAAGAVTALAIGGRR